MEKLRVHTRGIIITHLSYNLHKIITSYKPEEITEEKVLNDLLININGENLYLDVYFKNGKYNAYFTNEKQLLIYKLENYE